jgi:hypothetical protein
MSEFDSLLEIEPVSHKTSIPVWEGDVPHQVRAFVAKVFHSGKIYPVPATETNVLRLKSAFVAALKELAPDKVANFRDKLKKDADGKPTGELTGFSFSIGEKRGRKAATDQEG